MLTGAWPVSIPFFCRQGIVLQVPPSRRRLFQVLYGVGALAALAGGALLAHVTQQMRAPLTPSVQAAARPSSKLPRSFASPASDEVRQAGRESRGVRVEVLNGCGEPGVMDAFVRRLRTEGFDVIKTGNARAFGYPESMVIDRAGKRENADEVARALRIGPVVQQVKEDPYRIEDITVIVGRDHRKLGLR